MITLTHVTKRFGDTLVLADVSLTIAPGEFVCITGPSGAGKSTLIHLLTGGETVTEGQIEVDGVDLRQVPFPVMQIYRRRIGVVFQDYKLLPHRTVWENIAFPLEVCGAPQPEFQCRVSAALDRMNLAARALALPPMLSGGEKARAAIARAIVHRPMILMADEPTGNIDPEQSMAILKLLQDINSEGTTVILATHDVHLVDALRTRVIRLEGGRVVRDSIGSYTAEERPPKATAEGTHKVFAGVENRVPAAAKKKKSAESGIEITAEEEDDDDV